ncbi:MAG: glycosyltransferase family 4 protein [Methylotenera sp.]
MKTVHVIASGFANDNLQANIGGIETYIQLLARALDGQYELTVYQPSAILFESNISGVHVIGLGQLSLANLVNTVECKYLDASDVLLFSTDQYCCDTHWSRCAVIQHGVSWDLPIEHLTSSVLARYFEKTYRIFLSLRNFNKVKSFCNVICVDYNYYNWYQTLATREDRRKLFFTIPNCAGSQFKHIQKTNDGDAITICFARRFVAIRGIYIFLEVISALLVRYNNLRVIISGDGSKDVLNRLNEFSKGDSRVIIIKGSYTEMPDIYQSADIVVIPSLASEGTSLTALEAMAMGKCVVASNVGGLTNIIVDGFNGFLVSPTVGGFLEKLGFLLDNPGHIERTGKNAVQVAGECFTFEAWAKKWRIVINKISEGVVI